jgi:thiamine biosynthesis lipoprotein
MFDRGAGGIRPSRRALLQAMPALLVLGAGSSSARASVPELRASRALLGTQVDVILQGRSQPLLLEAMESAFAEMGRLSALMSRYDEGSETSKINRAAGSGLGVRISAELMSVLRAGKALHIETEGLFDPTIGALKSWHFEPGSEGRLPAPSVLQKERGLINSSELILEPKARSARLLRAGMALDLGGVAKLPILHAGLRRLREFGVSNALLNGGGDVLYLGSNQGAPWRVGLRDPRRPGRLIGVLPLQGEGVLAASGDYERYFFANGERQHHILDPRSGYPARAASGVSLWARDIEAVNGLGSAFMIGGREFAREWLSKHAALQVMLVEKNQAIWSTEKIKRSLVLAS